MMKLKIVFATPEAVPFAKTGGLADISGVLPGLLSAMGHSVKLFLPMYRLVKANYEFPGPVLKSIDCPAGSEVFKADIYQLKDDKTDLEINFIANDFFYDRPELYRDNKTGNDYKDNLERFLFFSKAVLATLKETGWKPDIIHANDWQAALIPSYLKTLYKSDPAFAATASIFTIHNMAYQGQFPGGSYDTIGLDRSYFAPLAPFEYWGKVNLMKAAICFADMVTTVSPTYAREIQSSNEYGMGLERVLKGRSDDLFGILNGVDYDTWSPEKDKLLPHRYSSKNLAGKKKNKLKLLDKAGLPYKDKQPLVGMISRLDSQKGFDLIADIMEQILNCDLQFVLLGTGAREYHEFFSATEKKYPKTFKAFLEFDNKLAHLIEAGSDMFLMPSRYEPCGLNQMYSLKYGTVPIVRKTGGLADTVEDFDPVGSTGTGFVFDEYKSDELLGVVKRARLVYNKRRTWNKIVRQGMNRDFSWENSAKEYINLYGKALGRS